MFKHYIITRFNLKAKEWTVTKNQTKVLDDNWLKNRFELNSVLNKKIRRN